MLPLPLWVPSQGHNSAIQYLHCIFLIGSCPLIGVSLLIQDSEIAETLGVSSPKQTDSPVTVSDRLQSSQDNRRRASTGSSTVSDAGSTNEVDNDSRIQYDHSFNKSLGMHKSSCIISLQFLWLGINCLLIPLHVHYFLTPRSEVFIETKLSQV